MDFFDDIFIPGNRLQTNSKFDEREQLWYWEYENEEGKHPLYMELGKLPLHLYMNLKNQYFHSPYHANHTSHLSTVESRFASNGNPPIFELCFCYRL